MLYNGGLVGVWCGWGLLCTVFVVGWLGWCGLTIDCVVWVCLLMFGFVVFWCGRLVYCWLFCVLLVASRATRVRGFWLLFGGLFVG